MVQRMVQRTIPTLKRPGDYDQHLYFLKYKINKKDQYTTAASWTRQRENTGGPRWFVQTYGGLSAHVLLSDTVRNAFFLAPLFAAHLWLNNIHQNRTQL